MIKEKERDDLMSNILTTIPTLNNHPTPNNPHNLPHYLTFWEIILNQHITKEEIEEEKKEFRGDYEDFILYLLETLLNINHLCIFNQETGEILYHYDNKTGEEYRVADL